MNSVKKKMAREYPSIKKIEQVWFYVLVLLIYILSATFTKITYLDLANIGFLLCVVVIIGGFVEKKMNFDIALFFLFQAMFIVSYTDSIRQNHYDVSYGWVLVSAYLIGKMLVGNSSETVNRRAVISYFALALGLLTTGVIDIIYNYKIAYFDTEWLISIWSNETVGRTVYDFYGMLMVSSIVYLVMNLKNHTIFSAVGIILALYYLVEMVRHEGRYCLFVLLLLVPVTALLHLYDKWPNITTNMRRRVYLILMGIIACLLFAFILYSVNAFGIKDLYKNSYLSGSGGIVHNVRFKYAYDSIKNIPGNLQGGYDSVTPIGAHNTWLEFGSKYGVIVLVLLECFRIIVIVDAIKLMLRRNSNQIRYLFIPSFIFLNLYYSMEPIGFRRRLYFMFILILFGMVRRINEIDKSLV